MIGIFVNSKSGKGKATKVGNEIVSYLINQAKQYEAYIDSWPTDLSNINEAWIVGGDGTLNYFLNKYPNIKIPLSIFKGGTGNDFSWQLYKNITVQQQMELVLNTKEKSVDAALCNNKIFINSVGIGFDGEVLKSMNSIRWLGGHLGYLLVVIKKIFSFKEFSFSIQSSTQKINNKFLLVNIANAKRTGGGFYISPLADVNDGLLNVVLSNPLSIIKRLKFLPVIEKGKHVSLPFIQHFTTTEATIHMQKITAAQLDGELIEAQQFNIKVLPNQFLFKY